MTAMTGAEFQCSREYLGLSATWVADKLGVARRTVYRWERGDTALPPKAVVAMQDWLVNTARAVSLVTLAALEDEQSPLLATPDEGFEYMGVEGFPASWQRMLCARAAERTGREIHWVTPMIAQAAAQ